MGLPLTAGALVLLVAGAMVLLVARRRLVVVRVQGDSMVPAYRSGDRVLVLRTRKPRFQRSQVVVFQGVLPGGVWRTGALPALDGTMWLLKRVAAVPGDQVPAAARRSADDPRPGSGQYPTLAETIPAGLLLTPGEIVPAGRLVVLGDGPVSEDSRDWGYLPMDRVLGVVIRKLATAVDSGVPARRAGTPES
ncbi:MAG TPA: signal peptidase I, partial [Nonomuraea sp.]|nr:signal peptidase I [Nonomuraea sp.]